MADYTAAANSIYDPQFNADKTALDQSLATTNATLDKSQRDVGISYDNNYSDYGKARNSQNDQVDFNASKSGLYGSGLMTNGVNQVMNSYQTNVDRLNTDRANKLADIAGQRQSATTNYSQNVGVLTSKYQALKNQYIQDQQTHDADVARQNAILAAQQQAARAYSSGGGGYSSGGGGGGGGSSINPGQEFLSYIAGQFAKNGGAGNKNITRQQQDAWANQWFASKGISNANRQGYWDTFNSTYHRSSDPTKDWRYKR